MTEPRYYIAAGPDEDIVKDFFRRRIEAYTETRRIAAKHGGKAVTRGRSFCGVLFDGDPPAGWRKVGSLREGAYYMPSRRSVSGKAAFAEIVGVRIPDATDLHSRFTDQPGYFDKAPGSGGGFFIRYIGVEIVGGKYIIRVPAGMDFAPAHSTPLKHSEYWRLKEDHAPKSEAVG